MQEIFVVGYEDYDFAKSLVVGEIQPIDFEFDLEQFDCLIFTSKNAIKVLAFLAGKYPQMQQWKTMPSFVIGKGSAEEILKQGGKLQYIASNFHSEIFIQELFPQVKDSNCLYLRAKEIISHLDCKLQNQGVQLTSKIIYQSKFKPLSCNRPPKNSILLFTAPSAYRFFLQNFDWDLSYRAIALGKTTFSSFENGIQKMLSPVQGIKKSVEFFRKYF